MITGELCSYILCKSKLWGIYTPIVEFRALNAPKYMPAGHAILKGMRLCESCAKTARVHDIITDRRWNEIVASITSQGGTMPDRDSLILKLGRPQTEPQ